MTELLINDLMSNDVKIRLQALEKAYSKIQSRQFYKELHGDEKIKLINECINTIKDPNPRIVVVGLQCIEHYIKTYSDDFQPYCNMTLQSLITKLGDSKANIRLQSMEVILSLVDVMGLSVGLDRIVTHLSSRNQKLKESILGLIMRLQEVYGEGLRTSSSLVPAIALTLNDSQSVVRQLAITTLVNLHSVFGDQLVETVMKHEIRAIQQKQLIDAIANIQSKPHKDMLAFNHNSRGTLVGSNIDDWGIDDPDPWSLIDNDDDDARCIKQSLSSQHRLSTRSTALQLDDAATEKANTTGPSRRSSTERRSMSAGTTTRRSSLGINDRTNTMRNGNTQLIQLGSVVGELIASDSVSDDSSSTKPNLLQQPQQQPPMSVFNPDGFMSFLTMEKSQSPINVIDDKDLAKQLGKIAVDLNKRSDWQTRLNALVLLQRIAMGNMADCKNCVELLRGMHELISSQVIDLRSAVSKEACRTISIIVQALKTLAYPLLEVWWMHLLRVAVVKIQVISSSADRCIRIALCYCTDEAKMVMLMVDACTSKNPLLRKLCFEYLCLAVAVWKVDIIDKHITSIKQVLRQGLSDADPNVRKNARQLYWLLYQCKSTSIQSTLKVLLTETDASTQKYLHLESDNSSLEMRDLLALQKHGLDIHLNAITHTVDASNNGINSATSSNYMTSRSSGVDDVMMSGADRSHRPVTTTNTTTITTVTTVKSIDQETPMSDTDVIDSNNNHTNSSSHRSSEDNSSMVVVDNISSKDDRVESTMKQLTLNQYSCSSMKPSKRLSLSGPMRVLSNPISSNQSLSDGRSHIIDEKLINSNATTINCHVITGTTITTIVHDNTINNNNSNHTSRGTSGNHHQISSLAVGPKRIIRNNNNNYSTTSASSAVADINTITSNETKANHPSSITSTSNGSANSDHQSMVTKGATHSSCKTTISTAYNNNNITSNNNNNITSNNTNNITGTNNSNLPMDVFIFSAETLRTMAGDSQWTSRHRAFEAINDRLKRAILTNEALNESIIDSFIDISIPHIADPHHKVAMEAIQVLHACISTFSSLVNNRLGLILISLFQRLADRRQPIRDQCNIILNLIRNQIRPTAVFASLSPRMHEVPDRMKAALMQYLGAIAPLSADFFMQSAQNTWAFLSRMAQILGLGGGGSGGGSSSGTGSKPSVTVMVAGRRLLELVYKTCPKMVCSQIATLPYQQQLVLKKLLEASVSDIDAMVLAASRGDWSNMTASSSSGSHGNASSGSNSNSGSSNMNIASSSPLMQMNGPLISTTSALSHINSPLNEARRDVVSDRSVENSPLDNNKVTPTTDNISPTTTNHHHQHYYRPNTQSSPQHIDHQSEVDDTTTVYTEPSTMPLTSRDSYHNNASYDSKSYGYTSYSDAYHSPTIHHPRLEVMNDDGEVDNAIASSSFSPVNHHRSYIHDSFISNYEAIKSDISSSSPFHYPTTISTSSPSSSSSYPIIASSSIYQSTSNHVISSSSPSNYTTMPNTNQAKPSPSTNLLINSNISLSSDCHSIIPLSSPLLNSTSSVNTTESKSLKANKATISESHEQHHHPHHQHKNDDRPSPLQSTRPCDDNQLWLLQSLHPSSPVDHRQIASKELKALIKTASDNYWVRNYAQIVAVLLESYKNIPPPHDPHSHHQREHHVTASTKSLLLLMKYRGTHMKNVLELLVTRLCECIHLVSTVISQLFELILSEFAKYDASRLVAVLLPYAGTHNTMRHGSICDDRQLQSSSQTRLHIMNHGTPIIDGSQKSEIPHTGEHSSQLRLLSLHVICASIRFMTSSQLLDILHTLITTILPSLHSAIADLRKSVIFILVEVYLSVGETLFPHIQSLSPPQRKLLTIYIDKKLADRNTSTRTAMM